MALAPGSRLGSYEVAALLGAGGMGEVYRAKDTRLGRDVAVKVLPDEFFEDKDRKERFEREAKALAALNHPNIAAVFSFEEIPGSSASSVRHLLVMELLDGESLRDRLEEGALPLRKAVDIAIQIANGLAAAHEKGIVHRDLKPENVFVTKDGRVKILDFGLAKLTQPERSADLTSAPTTPAPTDAGAVMGTAGYMSPEQVRGERVDARSDIFAFGAVLYEMLSGSRAFKGASAVETMHAILKEDPDLSAAESNVPAALSRIVHRCLEKQPDERFQSARDVGFALEAFSGSASGDSAATAIKADRVSPWRPLALLAVGVLAAAALGLLGGRSLWSTRPPSFTRLTFRRGNVLSARFAPDGRTVVYSAAWGSEPVDIFSTTPGVPEARSLGPSKANILSVSPSGKMFVKHAPPNLRGIVAEVSLAGGAPREILEDVRAADCAPDGTTLAVVRASPQADRLEYPPGHVIYETPAAGWISNLRVSPGGDLVAFLEHSVRLDNRGSVALVDRKGKRRTLSDAGWNGLDGIAWSPSGREVWFSNTFLYAVSLSGKRRVIEEAAGNLRLLDVARDGSALVVSYSEQSAMRALPPGETVERDLSWLDASFAADLSEDGRTLLFTERGDGVGGVYTTYLRKTDGSPAVRLGEGWAQELSPDGKWALAIVQNPEPAKLMLLPTGAGSPKEVAGPSINHKRATWFPDGKRVLFEGQEPGKGARLYVQDPFEGLPRPVTPEGVNVNLSWLPRPISPDGKWVAALSDDELKLYPIEAGQGRPVPGPLPGELPIRWSANGNWLYLFPYGGIPKKVFRVEVSTGRRELVRELMPADGVGVRSIFPVLLTPDGRSYAYSYGSSLNSLYLVKGLK